MTPRQLTALALRLASLPSDQYLTLPPCAVVALGIPDDGTTLETTASELCGYALAKLRTRYQ